MATKKAYTTFVLERPVAAPRSVVWGCLLELLEHHWAGGYSVAGSDPTPHGPGATTRFSLGPFELTERTITLEPPWRRVYEIVEGAPVELYQGTIAIRDDGAASLLVWAAVVDPRPDGASDEFVAVARRAVEAGAGQLVAAAEAAAGRSRADG